MNALTEICLIIALLSILFTLGSSRIIFCIRLVAVQGMALSILPISTSDTQGWHAWVLALGAFFVKGSLLPWFLQRTRRQAEVPREVEPYIGFGASLLAGIAMLTASFWMASLLPLPHQPPSALCLPVSFFGVFSGLFLIASRRKALTQVLGYLVLENGIYVFGIMLVKHQPLLVEMGVLLDLVVGVFVMGIAIFHISREFEHIDVDRLTLLKDATP